MDFIIFEIIRGYEMDACRLLKILRKEYDRAMSL